MSRDVRVSAQHVFVGLLCAGVVMGGLRPALGDQDAVAAAERRAAAAEARARAAEKRAKDAEEELRAVRASRKRNTGTSDASDRAADRETSQRLDDIITQQLLRDAGRR